MAQIDRESQGTKVISRSCIPYIRQRDILFVGTSFKPNTKVYVFLGGGNVSAYVVPTDEFSVSFVAPPSGNVEIMISVCFNSGSSGAGDLYAGLSTTNATSGYTQLADFHEEELIDQSGRWGRDTIQNYWTLTGLTAGTSYEYWVGFKSSSVVGAPIIEYGGNGSNFNPDFIMKATALPATITT